MTIIDNPRPGDKFPSPIEKGGYWIVPEGCYRVILADVTGYPITHMTRKV